MANTLNNVDVYAIVNAAVKEMYGANSTLSAFDTSSFVTVGAKLIEAPEQTLKALTQVFSRTIMDVKPYQGKFSIITRIPEEWGGRMRKISFYATEAQLSQHENTSANSYALEDGKSVDHYKITKVYPMELNFAGKKVLKRRHTVFLDQLRVAFRSEAEFSDFYAGEMAAIANDIEMQFEAQNRLMILNAIGATFNAGNARQKVNLVSEANTYYGYSGSGAKTAANYLDPSANLGDLVKYFVQRVKNDMDLLTENTELFHLTPARTDDSGASLHLLRHVPKASQRLLMYTPLWRSAEATIFPEIFNEKYLQPAQHEGVMYWQNPNAPDGVKVTPNQLKVADGTSVTGAAVTLSHCAAFLFDEDAMQTSVMLDRVNVTPVNADGDYYNVVHIWDFNFIFDQTHPMILYYLA